MDLVGRGASGYMGEKTRFPARSMKTKSGFLGYPRKVSLLEDLREGISLGLLGGDFFVRGFCV
jgi:hypothetical protein